jgi:hypothetical protein
MWKLGRAIPFLGIFRIFGFVSVQCVQLYIDNNLIRAWCCFRGALPLKPENTNVHSWDGLPDLEDLVVPVPPVLLLTELSLVVCTDHIEIIEHIQYIVLCTVFQVVYQYARYG